MSAIDPSFFCEFSNSDGDGYFLLRANSPKQMINWCRYPIFANDIGINHILEILNILPRVPWGPKRAIPQYSVEMLSATRCVITASLSISIFGSECLYDYKYIHTYSKFIIVVNTDEWIDICMLQCKVCMQTFMCTTSEVKCREHAEAKHPKSDVVSCFPHLQKWQFYFELHDGWALAYSKVGVYRT